MAAFLLMRQARDARIGGALLDGADRWLAMAGLVTGFTIWATHFVAILGYLPGVTIGYRMEPTLASLGLAAASLWLGFWLVLRRDSVAMRAWATLVIGAGLGAMHYLGLAALDLPVSLSLDWRYVLASLLLGTLPLYPALWLGLRGHGWRSSLKASSLLTLAVLMLHLAGMGAIRLGPARQSMTEDMVLSTGWMGAAIAGAALVVIANCLIVLSASRRSHAAIQASERDFAILAKGISDCAIYMLTPEGKIANWNAGAQRLKGYNEGDVLGEPLAIFYTDVDRIAGLPDVTLGIARKTGKFTGEGWRRRKDGSTFWAHVTIEKVNDATGRPIGYAKITRDMTRLKEDQDRLARIRTHLDTALGNMQQGLCLLDADHRLVLHNHRFAQVWRLPEGALAEGAPLEELVARALAARLPDAPGLASTLREAMLVTGAGPVIGEFDETLILSIASTALPDGGLLVTFDDITERRRSEARIAFLATHDALTTLPNRSHFSDWAKAELHRAHASGRSFAMITFDLDGFKEINDAQGQTAGDAAMVELGARLRAALGEGEMVARLGGDEFGAGKLFAAQSELDGSVSRLAGCFQQPVEAGTTPFALNASFGIALSPQDAATPEGLVNDAYLAMRRAKTGLPGSICYYETGMDEAARFKRQITADLRMAVVRDELRLLYQPQHTLGSGALKGYEALIRWHHAELGVIGPDSFIPIAEETGEILAIGQWVLRRACNDAARWSNDLTVAVNLSPIQLMQPDLVRMVAQVLVDTGLPARRLELEITESAIIADKARALGVLRQIKALGISIAMDDFGTGYASLDTLHAFPFDKIKIDKSFLLQSDDTRQAASIIRSVVALGRNLNIPVLAEGVETPAHLALVAGEGCSEGQGYLFGKPMALQAPPRLAAANM